MSHFLNTPYVLGTLLGFLFGTWFTYFGVRYFLQRDEERIKRQKKNP